jgi:hypothetical protein
MEAKMVAVPVLPGVSLAYDACHKEKAHRSLILASIGSGTILNV